jgi:hypothetical protein
VHASAAGAGYSYPSHMASEGGTEGSARTAALLLVALAATGCSILPGELNLSPFYRHRLDQDGSVLEMDVLWPIVHFERTAEGFSDFRIRPLYRYIGEDPASEHQFLWPLGRVRSDHEESHARLFPLWSRRSRLDEEGKRDVDSYLAFPLIWWGSHEAGEEDYLALFPLYADIPEFLTYDRFRAHLFPLHTEMQKEGHSHHVFLWPLIGIGYCAEAKHDWFRVLPLYSRDVEAGRYERHWLLWPFVHWSRENLDSDDPVSTLWLWPLLGLRKSRDVDGWSFLWPFFEKTSRRDHFYKLNILWPLFHYYENAQEDNVVQWWLWPLVGRVVSDDQRAWSILWPLIWSREYDDPEGTDRQLWILPVFWHVNRTRKDGSAEDFVKLWPIAHRSVRSDETGRRVGGDWSILSIWPWREGNAYGVAEAYGFLWELAKGRQRSADDRSVELIANLFTRRRRGEVVQASVPFLFNYEADGDGSVLRLLQFIPLRSGGGEKTR